MARGWESKSVESQIESAEQRKAARDAPVRTPEEMRKLSEIAQLELSLTRIANDLKTAVNPRHRAQLEAAMFHVKHQLEILRG